jgi:uncharacterized membrane protein HdeD (DUF308 family)
MSPIDEQQKQQLKNAATSARTQLDDSLQHFCRSLQLKAVIFGVVGVCALFWPGASMKYLAMFVGVCIILDGIGGLLTATRASDGRSYVGGAFVSLVVGGILLFWPNSIMFLLQLVGALVIYMGVRNLLLGRQLSAVDTERGTIQTTGIVACVIGLVIFLWPGIGVGTVSWILAIAALLVAALLFFVASRLQNVRSRLTQ